LIVITGADGIVGRAICALLRAEAVDFLPIVRTRKVYTHPNALVLNLADSAEVSILPAQRIKAIVHLAAAVPHSSYYPDNAESAQLTCSIDQNLLAYSRRVDCPVVYMSTCGLYNKSSTDLKVEDSSEIGIQSPYFGAKYQGEKLFSNEALAVILRLAAPIGPGQKASVVLSRFLMAGRRNAPLRLWGSGKREQNFIDVRDVARLIHQTILHPKDGVLNVASEKPTTMFDLATSVVKVLQMGTVVFDDRVDPREDETARYSIQKAYELYGWTPIYSLEDSIKMIAEEEFEQ
jgi:UDP-glucose 4-epimerase